MKHVVQTLLIPDTNICAKNAALENKNSVHEKRKLEIPMWRI